jgi:hypothetical protein
MINHINSKHDANVDPVTGESKASEALRDDHNLQSSRMSAVTMSPTLVDWLNDAGLYDRWYNSMPENARIDVLKQFTNGVNPEDYNEYSYESKASEGKVKSYCNICGYDTWRNEGEDCPYHQRVLSDGTFLWDEFNQDGEAYDKYGNRNNETCPNCGNTEAPFLIDDEFCNNCYVKPPESKWEKYDRYTSYGISDEEARGDIWNESKASEDASDQCPYCEGKGCEDCLQTGLVDGKLRDVRYPELKTSEGFDQGLYGHVDAKCKTCGVEFDSIPDMNDHYAMHSDHVSNLDDLDSNIPNSD